MPGKAWNIIEEAAERYRVCHFDPYEFFLDLLRSRGEERWSLEYVRGLWRAPRAPVGLYLEVPFCRARCSYCSFYSVVPASRGPVEAYLERLEREMDLLAPALRGKRMSSFYAGGGTPSILSPAQIARFLSAAEARFRFRADAERSFECEPTTLTPLKLETLRAAGINRLSIGVQSLHVAVLGRAARGRQTPQAALQAVRRARAAGFERGVNADLMLGLAGDTPETFMESLRRLAAEGPEKITLYALLPTAEYLRKHYKGDAVRFHSSHARFSSRVRRRLEEEAPGLGYAFSAASQCEWTLVRKRRINNPRRPHYEDSPGAPASTLGFGPTTRSYVSGRAFYRGQSEAGDSFDPARRSLLGSRITPADERLKSALMGLRIFGEVDLKAFEAWHERRFLKEFAGPVRELEREGLARSEGGAFRVLSGGPRDRLLAGLRLAGVERVREVLEKVLVRTSPPPVLAPRRGTRLPKAARRLRVEFKGGVYVSLEAEPARPGTGYLYAEGALGLRELMWYRGELGSKAAGPKLRKALLRACRKGRVLREEGARTAELIRNRLQRALRAEGVEARVRPEPPGSRPSARRAEAEQRLRFPEDFLEGGRPPAYRSVMPGVLARMLARERAKSGPRLVFAGIPACMLRHGGRALSARLWEHLAKSYLSMERDPAAQGPDDRTLSPLCTSCHFLGVCEGLPPDYASARGFSELEPVS